MNNKGYIKVKTLTVIATALLIIIGVVIPLILQSISYRERIKLVENYAEEMIFEIENVGYINDKIKFEAIEFLQEISFESFEIDGSKEKVQSGEDVFLSIEIEVKNLLGGSINKDRIYKRGIAK